MKKPNFLSRLFNDDNFERPFFLFLTLVLVGMYIWALTGSTSLHSTWKIVVFTLLMNTHIALYWLSPLVFKHRQWLAPYLIFQGLVAFGLGMLCQVLGILFGLYPGLIGLVIGMPTKRIWRVLAVGYFLLLSLVNFMVLTGSGTLHWWLLGTVPIVIFVTMYVSMYLRQAEAREQAQLLLKDLESANRQLSEYAARVEDLTIANERQRMARELHDTLSQGLAGLILQLEAVEAHLMGKRPERALLIVQQMKERARETLAESRQAIANLRQAGPRDLGDAARQEAEHFTSSTGIPCQVEVALPAAIPEPVAETAIRVIVEGLTNIARHALAKNAKLRIAIMSDSKVLEIKITDDGIGFDPAAIEAGHFGLLGMRERVRLAGGSFEVQSTVGQGTRIVIRFSLEESIHG